MDEGHCVNDYHICVTLVRKISFLVDDFHGTFKHLNFSKEKKNNSKSLQIYSNMS